MGKKNNVTVRNNSDVAEYNNTENGPVPGKYRIKHSQNGESVELNFHAADRRDAHAHHLRSIGTQNVEPFDAEDDVADESDPG